MSGLLSSFQSNLKIFKYYFTVFIFLIKSYQCYTLPVYSTIFCLLTLKIVTLQYLYKMFTNVFVTVLQGFNYLYITLQFNVLFSNI